MFLVITTIQLKPGALDDGIALLQQTTPDLVADQPDWIGAEFTTDREGNTMTVIARWARPESYRTYAASDRFQRAMTDFAVYFEGPPQVRLVERLFQMGHVM